MNYTAEQMREYQNRRREALRAELRLLLGGKCARCGKTEDLEFDHIDPKTKLFSIANGLDKPRAVLLQEVETCQLLCTPHHIEKNSEDGTRVRGERQWKAKLTVADVQSIRASTLHYRELMKIYDITKAHVFAIRRRAAWKHVDLSLPGYSSGQRDLTVNQMASSFLGSTPSPGTCITQQINTNSPITPKSGPMRSLPI